MKKTTRKYCISNCQYLSITEEEQNKTPKGQHKLPHLCDKFHRQVFHQANTLNHNPALYAVKECTIN